MTSVKQDKQLLTGGRIPLRNKNKEVIEWVLVDQEDFNDLNKYKWARHSTGQPVRSTTINGKDVMIYMRREIMGVSNDKSVWVKAKNGPLDCRKQFLEIRKRYENRWRETNLLRKYGLNIDQYNKILAEQGGKCAICGHKPLSKSKISGTGKIPYKERFLAVDHCHQTNKIRGLLCYKCNVGLGSFEDNPKLLKAALMYVQ